MSRLARVLIGLIVLSLAVATFLWWNDAQPLMAWNLPSRPAEQPEMGIVSHGGDTQDAPEETAGAIWAAAALPANGIEFDVHPSADGTWWVIHDATVDAATDGTGTVEEMSDSELAALHVDAGRGYRTAMAGTIRLATLTEVLDGLNDYNGMLFVDLQHAVGGDPAALAGLLGRHSATIIVRTIADAQAVKQADGGTIQTMIRVNRPHDDPSVDELFFEAWTEATVDRVRAADRPVGTYLDERYAGRSEENPLRRAWAAGVAWFMSRDVVAATALRDRLSAEWHP